MRGRAREGAAQDRAIGIGDAERSCGGCHEHAAQPALAVRADEGAVPLGGRGREQLARGSDGQPVALRHHLREELRLRAHLGLGFRALVFGGLKDEQREWRGRDERKEHRSCAYAQ
ncbi:MAG: hypothetical protein WD793_02080 [Steroidobacteraceae bacterium]